ncbi:substrate-binding periplasmic protein [Halobacteriovorax marinus]|uniref:substrate-binding periplasmic protein n=1 Tax=Halobacteriovorax marinus TaxID=97084 RepID=UPI003A8F0A80
MNKFILAYLLLTFSANALVANLAVEDSWPPYSDENGKGISTNIIKAAFKAVDVEAKVSVFPYARALRVVQTGEYDGCYNVTKQESTKKLFHFGEEPILKSQASFFQHRETPLKYEAIHEIPKGTTLVLIRGYEYGDNFDKIKSHFKLFYVNNQKQIIKMILNKRAALTIMFDNVAKYHLKDNPRAKEIKKTIPNHMSDIYVGFNLKSARSKTLSKKLDEGLRIIKANGVYSKLIQF